MLLNILLSQVAVVEALEERVNLGGLVEVVEQVAY
jgi:hypothetical protein